jgi:DNA primase
MLTPITRRDLAIRYHRLLPANIRQYLNDRGIPDEIIDRELLGWNGRRITIPVFGASGDLLTFRNAKSPDDTSNSPKMLSEIGSSVELYGWKTLQRQPHRVVICEGEFDRLVLEARGFQAVTSTGGAGIFLREWIPHFEKIRRIYICFDRDAAGQAGAEKVKHLLPRAAIVRLPADVGERGDITDYFVRCGRMRADFEALLAMASADEENRTETKKWKIPRTRHIHISQRRRAERLKSSVRLENVLQNFMDLRKQGQYLVGLCPFHREAFASFTVYSDGTYYCFGCHEHGDVIEFLMRKEGMTFGQALAALERFLYTGEIHPTSNAA